MGLATTMYYHPSLACDCEWARGSPARIEMGGWWWGNNEVLQGSIGWTSSTEVLDEWSWGHEVDEEVLVKEFITPTRQWNEILLQYPPGCYRNRYNQGNLLPAFAWDVDSRSIAIFGDWGNDLAKLSSVKPTNSSQMHMVSTLQMSGDRYGNFHAPKESKPGSESCSEVVCPQEHSCILGG